MRLMQQTKAIQMAARVGMDVDIAENCISNTKLGLKASPYKITNHHSDNNLFRRSTNKLSLSSNNEHNRNLKVACKEFAQPIPVAPEERQKRRQIKQVFKVIRCH